MQSWSNSGKALGTLLVAFAMLCGSIGSAEAPAVASSFGLDAAADPKALDAEGLVARAVEQWPPAAQDAFQRATQEKERVEQLSELLSDSNGLAAPLAAAIAELGIEPASRPALPQYASLGEALEGMAAATGIAPPALSASQEDLLPEEIEAEIRRLAAAVVVAVGLREAAFADLTPEEMSFLQAFGDELATSPPRPDVVAAQAAIGEEMRRLREDPKGTVRSVGSLLGDESPETLDWDRVLALAGRIDFASLLAGAQVLADATDRAAERLPLLVPQWPELAASDDVDVPKDAQTLAPTFCIPPYGLPLIPLSPLIEVGSLGPDCFGFFGPTMITIDPGPGGPPGDLYASNAGGTSGLLVPVAVAIDVAGDDVYHSPPGTFGTVQVDTFVEGGAQLGLAVFADLGGDDDYQSGRVLDSAPFGCPSPAFAPVGMTVAFAQGAAFLGVGLMLDGEGSDQYNSDNYLHECAALPADDLDFTAAFVQGSAVLGIGVLVDQGSDDSLSDDRYNTGNVLFNELPSVDPGPPQQGDTEFLVEQSQGAGMIISAGIMVDTYGNDRYNSENQVLTEPSGFPGPPPITTYVAECVQGIVGGCAPIPCIQQQEREICLVDFTVSVAGGILSAGVLVDALGDDAFNCANFLDGDGNSGFAGPAFYAAALVQGSAAGIAGIGAMAEGGGDDCYNGDNAIEGSFANMNVLNAQGTGTGLLGIGVLLDRARNDEYNSNNMLVAREPTLLNIFLAQGAAAGLPAIGVLADVTSPQGEGSDVYNSFNTQVSGGGDAANFFFIQGSGLGGIIVPTSIGVMLELDSPYQDPLSPDTFNSGNTAFAFGTTLTIFGAQGSAPGGSPGIGIMVEVGVANVYNSFNAYVLPTISDVLAVCTGLVGVCVFADLSIEPFWIPIVGPFLAPPNALIGPDTYNLGAIPGGPVGCVGLLAVAVDLVDGIDMPPLGPGLICLDL